MIDEKKLIEDIEDFKRCQIRKSCDYLTGYISALSAVEEMIAELPKVGEWIPFKTRPTDEEEKEVFEYDFMFDCKLPDEDDEIIVTYRNGLVDTDVFLRDGYECYLDSGCEFGTEAIAWMPLPEPYKGEEE